MAEVTPTPETGLLAELKRRGVVRAVVAYAVFAFAALQVSEPLLHALRLPDAWLTGLVVLLGVGFPMTAGLSWVFDLTRRGVVRTEAADVAPGARPSSRLALAGVTLLAAGLGAVLTWVSLRPAAPPVDADGRVSVAVADFANQTGEPALDALSGLLITSLEQSRKLKVLTRGRMLELLRQAGEGKVERIDEATARLVGGRAGVRALLLASIQKLGGGYVVELRALDTGKDHYLFTLREQAGDQAGILPLIDRLSEQTRLRLREKDAEVQASDIKVAEAVTPNLEAYRHYFKGKELLARLDGQGAAKEFRRALELEPTFALAQLELGLEASFWAEKGIGKVIEAGANAAGLPEKEREVVLTLVDVWQSRNRQAVERSRRLAERFPEDREVLFAAARAALEPQEALVYFRRAVALVPDDEQARLELSFASAPMGRAPEALQQALAFERDNPTWGAAAAVGVARLATGDTASAVADFRRADRPDAGPGVLVALVLALTLNGEVAAARVVAARGQGPAADFLPTIVDAYQGRLLAASARLSVVAGDPSIQGGTWRMMDAIVHAAAGDLEAARRLDHPGVDDRGLHLAWLVPNSERRRSMLERRGVSSRAGRVVNAAILRDQGDLDAAAQSLDLLDPLECGIPVWLLGAVESDRGRHAAALEAFARFERCHLSSYVGLVRLILLGDARIRSARGLAALGRADEGRRVLERQLAQWKDADPDLPLLIQARALCRELGCRAR